MATNGSDTDPAPLPFGLTDLPATQDRRALALDLAKDGHLVVAGSQRSGRSTVLRTIAGSVADRTSPADVHLYGIDCGANALAPLVTLTHCGAVVHRDEVDRVERLLARLRSEVGRRQQLLAGAGFSGLSEQRAAAALDDRLPWLLVLLDSWDGFVTAYADYDYGRLVEAFVQLLREGPAVGLRAVVTGDRSALSGQVSTVFERRLVLHLAEPADYGHVGINEREVPTAMPPGRVLEPTGGGAGGLEESQIALLDADPAGPAQVAALQRRARAAGERRGPSPPSGPQRPFRVDPLPSRITAAEALELAPEHRPSSPLWALVGAGGDDLAPVGVDLLVDGPGFTVAGSPRSGRSTALVTMVRSLLARQVPVVLVAPRRSPLRDLADLVEPGVAGVAGILDGEADDEALASAIDGRTRYVVVVDDAELLVDTPLDDALADVVRAARDGEHGVLLAGLTDDLGRAYRGFAADALRSRSGLLLGARSPEDGDILGLRLPRDRGGSASGPVGRGLLVRQAVAQPVQVALPD